MPDVLLEIEDVAQTLGGNKILDGVAFKVEDRVRPGAVTGQVVALLGPSGVGKTRLLRILAGLDAPDRGHVKVKGGAAPTAGSVGVVFQHYPLSRHRTVTGNLEVAGAALGLGAEENRRRSAELLERFDLAPRARAYPAQLSGGQRQRVAIAQQLMRHRPLLLMDEPFSGLDPAALEDVMEVVAEVAHQHEHNTIVIVTHDIRAALMVADTVLMLGRNRTPSGVAIPGARIQRRYDLVEKGLAWRKDVDHDPEFVTLEREIKGAFRAL